MKVPRGVSTDRAVEKLSEILNGRVDLVDNMRCKIVDVEDTGPADTQFLVVHNLGIIPTAYIVNIDRSGVVYDSSRATWTERAMTLKCSVPNAVLKLIVF